MAHVVVELVVMGATLKGPEIVIGTPRESFHASQSPNPMMTTPIGESVIESNGAANMIPNRKISANRTGKGPLVGVLVACAGAGAGVELRLVSLTPVTSAGPCAGLSGALTGAVGAGDAAALGEA